MTYLGFVESGEDLPGQSCSACTKLSPQPGVEPDDYERFFAEEIATVVLPGWKTHLLKGDRGERAGKYLVLLEIESLEARDRYFPRPARSRRSSLSSSNSTQKRPRHSRNGRKWAHSVRSPDISSDYVVVAE